MAPLTSALPLAASQQPGSPTAKAAGKEPVDADIRVCLDFIKGRCARKRCRFHHPEMAGYQQLSGAVQAQAGKQICEVWAMAGTCKFGAKCNKLHPIVVNQPAQPAMAISVPVAMLPQPVLVSAAPAPTVSLSPPLRADGALRPLPGSLPPSPLAYQATALAPYGSLCPLGPLVTVPPLGPCSAAVPQLASPAPAFPPVQVGKPASPPPLPAGVTPELQLQVQAVIAAATAQCPPRAPGSPPAAPAAPAAAAAPMAPAAPATPAAPAPLRPQHVSPPTPSQRSSDPEAQLQDLANSILKSLETVKEPRHELAPRKGPLPAPPSPRGRSLASLFDMDRIFLRVPSDEDAETDLLSNLSVHP